MKKAIFLLLAIPTLVHAQLTTEDAYRAKLIEKQQKEDSALIVDFPRDSVTNDITFAEVVKLDNDAQQLYSNAKLLVATSFKTTPNGDLLNDDVSKTVLVRSTTSFNVNRAYNLGYLGKLVYLVKIECKENRYRYTLSDFVYHITDKQTGSDATIKISDDRPGFFNKKEWHLIQFQAKSEAFMMINRIKNGMAQSSSDF